MPRCYLSFNVFKAFALQNTLICPLWFIFIEIQIKLEAQGKGVVFCFFFFFFSLWQRNDFNLLGAKDKKCIKEWN